MTDLADRIKISSSLRLPRKEKAFDRALIVLIASRPFDQKHYYADGDLSDRMTRNHSEMWGSKIGDSNPTIALRCVYSSDPIAPLAVRGAFDYGLLKTGNGGTEGLPRYRYTKSGERIDNITDWALNKFVERYGRRVMKAAAVRLAEGGGTPPPAPPRTGRGLASWNCG